MEREVTIKELENIDNIEEPIIIKRKDKEDLVVISLKQYKKELFLTELSNKLEESEKQYAEGKTHDAEEVFGKLREKYGY